MTPREFAKNYIKPYVLRGETVHELANSHMGYCGATATASIGGYFWRAEDLGKKDSKPFRKLKRDEIGVEKFEGKEVFEVFKLADLVKEILSNKEQLALF